MTQSDGEQDSRASASDDDVMLDAITDLGIARLDAAGHVTFWSAGARQLLGYSSADVLGRPAAMLYSADDRASGVAETELATARESGRFAGEVWQVRKDGHRFRAGLVTTAVRGAAGQVTGFARIVRDLACEQEHAYNTFHALLEAAPDAMVIVGADGRITFANAQADRLFGHRREDLIGADVEMLLPARFRGRHARYRTDFFAEPSVRRMGTRAGMELFAQRRDGGEFPVEVSLSPLRIDQGMQVIAAIRDITERRDYEQRLRRQYDEIMELSTPVIQVWDKVLVLPLIGTLDSLRAAKLTEGLLISIGEKQAEVVIFDISGVPTIDTMVAQHLLRTVQAAALMGTASILCGVRPEIAQAMVHLGIEIDGLMSRGTLQDALQLALTLLTERADAMRDTGVTLGRIGPR